MYRRRRLRAAGQALLGFLVAAGVVVVGLATPIPTELADKKWVWWLAVALVGLSSFIQLVSGLKSWPGGRSEREAEVHKHLRVLLRRLHELEVLHSSHYYMLSLHVWEIPKWYRRLFPFALREKLGAVRRRLDRIAVLQQLNFRPSLTLVAWYSHRKGFKTSGVKWRKGEGIVGKLLTQQDPGVSLAIDYESPEYVELRERPDLWDDSPDGVTLGLQHDLFLKLASKYGQVVGVQVAGRGWEPIGALTLEAAEGYQCDLNSEDIVRLMLAAVETLSPLLELGWRPAKSLDP